MTRLPPHIVANQLNIFAPVGIATAIVVIMNAARQNASIPEVSMWCPHTMKPTTPIPAIAKTIDLYPKIDLLALVASTSDTIPNAGIMTTYTSGCPKNQNRCWNNKLSPPLVKNTVPIVWSNNRNTIPIINAGRDIYSMKTLTNTDQVNKGIFIHVTPGALIVNTVVMKLTPPRVDDAPSMNIPDKNAVVPKFEPYCDNPSPRFASVSDE